MEQPVTTAAAMEAALLNLQRVRELKSNGA
jgi:hypothetical protein